MSNAAAGRLPARPRQVRAALIGLLLALAGAAALMTANRMAGMERGPGADPGTLGFFVVSWVVMMAAMMFPSILPMVLVFERIQRGRRRRGERGVVPVAVFVGGYLVMWTAFGLAVYGLTDLMRRSGAGILHWQQGGRWLAAAVLIAAAAYQLTPSKNACLRRCRGPLEFLTERWREGRRGALRMGMEHGGWCVGCCWALMASLVTLGVMNLVWMVLVATLIASEKLFAWKGPASRAVALVLLGLGLGLALSPASVPGFVVPGG